MISDMILHEFGLCKIRKSLPNGVIFSHIWLLWKIFRVWNWRDCTKRCNTHFAAMMTESNGNIFRVTDPLCGEFTGDRTVTRSIDVYFYLRLNKRSRKQSWGWWFETPSRSLWRHRNGKWILSAGAHWGLIVTNALSVNSRAFLLMWINLNFSMDK